MKPITVVIPALNEATAIAELLQRLQAECGDLVEEIVLVDDGSTDGTGDLAAAAGATVLRHARNRGYGASLRYGIRQARTEFVVTFDADGQHRPEDVLRLWEDRDAAEMVVGAREGLIHSAAWRMPGKWLLRWMANYLCGQSIPDLNSGLRLLRRETALRYVHLCPQGFSFSTTITMALHCRRYEVRYVPIKPAPRVGKSTVTLATGMETLLLILRIATLFNPLRVFLPASAAFVAAGLVWGLPYFLSAKGLSIGSALMFITALLLFALGLLCDQISQLRLERFE